MNSKTFVFIGMMIGSSIGGLIPSLWGDTMFSIWSLFLSAAGALVGIYCGYKISRNF